MGTFSSDYPQVCFSLFSRRLFRTANHIRPEFIIRFGTVMGFAPRGQFWCQIRQAEESVTILASHGDSRKKEREHPHLVVGLSIDANVPGPTRVGLGLA